MSLKESVSKAYESILERARKIRPVYNDLMTRIQPAYAATSGFVQRRCVAPLETYLNDETHGDHREKNTVRAIVLGTLLLTTCQANREFHWTSRLGAKRNQAVQAQQEKQAKAAHISDLQSRLDALGMKIGSEIIGDGVDDNELNQYVLELIDIVQDPSYTRGMKLWTRAKARVRVSSQSDIEEMQKKFAENAVSVDQRMIRRIAEIAVKKGIKIPEINIGH